MPIADKNCLKLDIFVNIVSPSIFEAYVFLAMFKIFQNLEGLGQYAKKELGF